ATPAAPPLAAAPVRAWLEALPEGGIRRVFAHLADHGSISEVDIVAILDRAELRQFRLKYKEFLAKVPFDVRIDTNDNVKTYLREGTAP
ncbi:MAG TPA: hypothetical protein PKW35_02205, partial [Nannocystaceae bacterium]|nr:hypothetical protein [Nannocystaceae bacterium]